MLKPCIFLSVQLLIYMLSDVDVTELLTAAERIAKTINCISKTTASLAHEGVCLGYINRVVTEPET